MPLRVICDCDNTIVILSPQETLYLEASQQAAAAAMIAQDAAQARALAQALALAGEQRRAANRLRLLVAGLSLFLVSQFPS